MACEEIPPDDARGCCPVVKKEIELFHAPKGRVIDGGTAVLTSKGKRRTAWQRIKLLVRRWLPV